MTRLTSTERYMIIAVTIVTVIILGIMFLMGISTSNDVPAVSQKEREAFEQQMNSKDSTTTHRKKKSSSVRGNKVVSALFLPQDLELVYIYISAYQRISQCETFVLCHQATVLINH